MNAVITQPAQGRALSKVDIFMGKVLPPEDRAALKSGMPAHVPFDRFERNLHNAIMNEPKLLECNPREVFREVAKIASLGLVIDAQLGECYLIVGYGKNSPTPQIRVGYRGLIKLARQSGDVAGVYAHEVCENDYIEAELGTEKRLVHKPDLFGDRGAIRGFYAVIKYKDGDSDFEPMNPTQINAIRDRSDGYKAFKAGKIKDTPWNSGYDEMAKKTTIRRLMKRSPMSPDLARAIKIEDEAEFPQEIAGTLASPPKPPSAPQPALTPPKPPVQQAEPVQAEPAPDATNWPLEIESYRNRLGECETEDSLAEAIESYGPVFDDAPADVQSKACAAESDRRSNIVDRTEDDRTPTDPREAVLHELRSAIMSGDRRVAALLNDLPAERRALVTDADVKDLKEAQRAIEAQRNGGGR